MAHNINTIISNPTTRDHFIRRGIALIIDIFVIWIFFIISGIVALSLTAAFGWQSVEGMEPGNMLFVSGAYLQLLILIGVVILILSMLYFIVMELKFDGTMGKKLLGLKVEPTEGAMELSKVIIRNLAKLCGILIGALLGNFLFVFGVIIGLVLVDTIIGIGQTSDPRQKYTDKMAGTTVVRTDVTEDMEDLLYIPSVQVVEDTETGSRASSKPSELSKDAVVESVGKRVETHPSIVKKYADFFDLDEERALNLYKAGYKRYEDLKDAIAEDLVLVDKINPTVARGIINTVQEGNWPYD